MWASCFVRDRIKEQWSDVETHPEGAQMGRTEIREVHRG